MTILARDMAVYSGRLHQPMWGTNLNPKWKRQQQQHAQQGWPNSTHTLDQHGWQVLQVAGGEVAPVCGGTCLSLSGRKAMTEHYGEGSTTHLHYQ